MSTVRPRPPRVEMDFTDAQLTGFGGWSVLGQMAERLGLPEALSDNWTPVIAKDVDRPDALPLAIDREAPNPGKVSAARRVARTISVRRRSRGRRTVGSKMPG